MYKYSIAIRTLGYGGEKYQALLNSIANQKIKPENIYIVIANDYNLPMERIGTEEFIYSEKGMLYQRIYGMNYAIKHSSSDILLCLDDDVSFEDDYAEKALKIMESHACDMLMPIVLDKDGNSNLVEQVSKVPTISSLIGIKRLSSKSKYRVQIMSTGGFVTNPTLRGEVPTQSSHGTGFWIRMSKIKELQLEDELWIDSCKYALPEDQVVGYKAYLIGLNTIYSTNIQHRHLDAGTSITSNRMYYQGIAGGRNYLIFWHRFILPQSTSFIDKIKKTIAISWRISAVGVQKAISSIVSLDLSRIKGYTRGIIEGLTYLNSEEYRRLPKIVNTLSHPIY